MYAEFKEKRAAYLAAEEARRQENLNKKQAILDRIREIAEDIDNVNVKFSEFQQLQQDSRQSRIFRLLLKPRSGRISRQ